MSFSANVEFMAKELSGQHAWNSAQNRAQVVRLANQKLGRVQELPKRSGQPVIILGSGASLDDSVEMLRQWRGDIIAPASLLSTLEALAIRATIILAADPSPEVGKQLQVWPRRISPLLVTHPAVDESVFRSWPGDVSLFRLETMEAWAGNYPWIFGDLYPLAMMGCTVNLAVNLAELLGYSVIYLAGVDFGYQAPEENSKYLLARATTYKQIGPFRFQTEPQVVVSSDDTGIRDDGDGPTTEEMIYYKLLLYSVLKIKKLKVFVVGQKSTLKALPSVEADKVKLDRDLSTAIQKYPNLEKAIDAYTIPHGLRANVETGQLELAEKMKRELASLKAQSEYLEGQLSHWLDAAGMWSYVPKISVPRETK